MASFSGTGIGQKPINLAQTLMQIEQLGSSRSANRRAEQMHKLRMQEFQQKAAAAKAAALRQQQLGPLMAQALESGDVSGLAAAGYTEEAAKLQGQLAKFGKLKAETKKIEGEQARGDELVASRAIADVLPNSFDAEGKLDFEGYYGMLGTLSGLEKNGTVPKGFVDQVKNIADAEGVEGLQGILGQATATIGALDPQRAQQDRIIRAVATRFEGIDANSPDVGAQIRANPKALAYFDELQLKPGVRVDIGGDSKGQTTAPEDRKRRELIVLQRSNLQRLGGIAEKIDRDLVGVFGGVKNKTAVLKDLFDVSNAKDKSRISAAQDLATDFGDMLAQWLKATSGTAVNEAEAKRISTVLGDPSNHSFVQIQSALKSMRRILKRTIKDNVAILKAGAVDLDVGPENDPDNLDAELDAAFDAETSQ